MEKNFKQQLQERVREVDGIVCRYLPREEGLQRTVLQAMNYAVCAGGKRLRPLLMQETFYLFSGNRDCPVLHRFMAAIEMIHTYSLIHDDLPALDNDDYRRGRKTVHVVYGEDMAILAGDGLLNYAFETAAGAFALPGTDPKQIGEAMRILTAKPGIYGMIGGQAADVELTGQKINREQLMFIYENKTGALIEGAMMIGAVLAGALPEQIRNIEQIASQIGIAFQIQDDILDITADEETLGKPVHSDEKNEKTTYAALMGLEQAAGEVERLSMAAMEAWKALKGNNDFLIQLTEYLIHRDR